MKKEMPKLNLQSLLKKFESVDRSKLLIVFLIGILLLVIVIPTKNTTGDGGDSLLGTGQEDETEETETTDTYIRTLENHLARTLSQMSGAGDVTVMITLQSSAEKVVEKDLDIQNESITESDSQGGTRTTQNSNHGESTVYDSTSSDNQAPYISKELTPRVEGVLVLAEGGDDAVVQQQIMEAVQALFGIDTHKIRIMKKGE